MAKASNKNKNKSKKNKKEALKKRVISEQQESPELIKAPDYQDEKYLEMKEEMEAILEKERLEYEARIAEIEEQKRIEQENIEKANKMIEDAKQEQKELEELEEKERYKQPEILKSVQLFNNLDDKRMKIRKKELEKTNAQPKDFRIEKYVKVNKLPQKPRTAKLDRPDQVATMLVSSKKEIFEKSGLTKAMKKARLAKSEKLFMEKMFLERVKREAKFINMFQPEGLKIPMYEIYWLVQNNIVSGEKIYVNLKTPFLKVPEFEFCDSLVWSVRYFLEMAYTESYDFDFMKKEVFVRSQQLYRECLQDKGVVTAYDVEELAVVLMDEIISRYRYSSMVVNV